MSGIVGSVAKRMAVPLLLDGSELLTPNVSAIPLRLLGYHVTVFWHDDVGQAGISRSA